MKFNKNQATAIATLIGATIGAGILGLPYMAVKAGIINTIIMTVVLGIAILFLNLYIGEIVLRTKKIYELSGYVEKYWSKFGKFLMAASIAVWIIGALTAYTLGVGEAAFSILNILSPNIFAFLFYIIMCILLYFGLKTVAQSELILNIFMGFFIATILIIGFLNIDMINMNLQPVTIPNLFLPIGVILFALMAEVAIPEMRPQLKNPKKLKKCIIIGTIIPIVIYLLFAIVVGAVIGLNYFESLAPNQRVATIPLGQLLGKPLLITSNLFAIVSMATSFLVLGLALIWTLRFDYKIKKMTSWVATCVVPVFFIMSNKANFISAMDFAGSIAGGVTGVVLIITYHKAKLKSERKPEFEVKNYKYITPFLILIFVVAVVQQIVRLFF